MKLEDFKSIDYKNMGTLQLPVKAVILGVLATLIVAAGYWNLWSPSLEELSNAQAKEVELRAVFVNKKRQAINLDAYKQQMVDIERTFGALLRQLPDKSQMDALLTDINQVGLERGLEFELFKPGQEKQADFYAELPISIKVTGSYHDMGAFATDVSKLSRIVTLNDLSILPMAKDPMAKDVKDKDNKEPRLAMEATAKTYRYLDASEISGKKKSDKKDKK
jgi:type IV pilus assembly protein PilO